MTHKNEEARLDIHEPPRFFEAFLRARAYTEPPNVTDRVRVVGFDFPEHASSCRRTWT